MSAASGRVGQATLLLICRYSFYRALPYGVQRDARDASRRASGDDDPDEEEQAMRLAEEQAIRHAALTLRLSGLYIVVLGDCKF